MKVITAEYFFRERISTFVIKAVEKRDLHNFRIIFEFFTDIEYQYPLRNFML